MPPRTMSERLLSEQRAIFELGAFGVAWPWFSLLPRGDGGPVLVLPGFAGSDSSTLPLRTVLRNRVYLGEVYFRDKPRPAWLDDASGDPS